MEPLKLSSLPPHAAVYFIGIGGISMNGIAEMLIRRGFSVSGSDREESPIVQHLRALGAVVHIGQKYENINPSYSLVVYTGAIHDDNPELVHARELGIPCIERPILLGMLLEEYQNSIAVSGTHGKTTVTGMISTVFLEAGLDPTINIGGYLPPIGGTSRIGSHDCFIVEACEYRKSFLNFKPSIAVITNIEADHLDFYKDLDDIIGAFRAFAEGTRKDGTVIAHFGDESVRKAVTGLPQRLVTFGLDKNADYYAEDIRYNDSACARFSVCSKGKKLFETALNVPGEYNVINALAAAAACACSGIEPDQIGEGLQHYEGTKRRFEQVGTVNGCILIDDYAHHPTEIKNTIAAAQKLHKKHLYTIMQAHTYTRLNALFDDFASCMKGADEVVVCDVYAAREAFDPTASPDRLAEKMRENGINACHISGFQNVADYYRGKIGEGDILISIGAGDVNKILDLIQAMP